MKKADKSLVFYFKFEFRESVGSQVNGKVKLKVELKST
jgi:hypothetical protein